MMTQDYQTEPDSIAAPLESPPEVAEEKRKSGLRSLLWEILQTTLLTLAIFVAVRSVIQNFRVEGASMEPTLVSGQYLIVNKAAYAGLDESLIPSPLRNGKEDNGVFFIFGPPQRGDIVVLRFPQQPDKDFIKRVIGIPGDTIKIERGQVFVNGKLLEESYIKASASYSRPERTIPPGSYYVLGDNRANSSDSHVWGLVPSRNMIGKAWLSYWPPGLWGVVDTPAYAH